MISLKQKQPQNLDFNQTDFIIPSIPQLTAETV